jgi:hypothetical protein
MAKHDILLKAFQENLNDWVCRMHNSGNANQSAATFRELKKQGYSFEETGPKRWDKSLYCNICKTKTTHSKLLFMEPVFSAKPRITIPSNDRNRILKLLNMRDAFTGGSITSTPEIDHKIPWSRLEQDINTLELSDNEIKYHFQLLTGEHNLLKDRACTSCIKNNIRPTFFEINYWYDGTDKYLGSCVGCGWHDGVLWRNELNKKLRK